MIQSNAFLLCGVPSIKLAAPVDCYDQRLEMNMIVKDGVARPFVLDGKNPTESKTYQHPADDDPDPDDERCY